MLTELLRREKEAKIIPDADVDAFMKVKDKIDKELLKFMFEMRRKLHYKEAVLFL